MTAAADSRLLTGFADNQTMVDMVTRLLDDGQRQVDLLVPDMRCSACGDRIKLLADELSGVSSIQVNPARHHVSVDYDPQRITLNGLLKAIEEAGYSPTFMALPDDDPRLIQQRRTHLKRLGLAGIAMMQVKMLSIALYAGEFQGMEPFYEQMWLWVGLLFTTPVVFYSSAPFFRNAWQSLRDISRHGSKRIGLAMDVPVALAIGIAYLASIWATVMGGGEVYYDSITMFAFLLLGARYLEQSLRHRLARFDNMLSILPENVTRIQEGRYEEVPLRQIKAGDELLVTAATRIPVDGHILQGATDVDESTLTGESEPVAKDAGDAVYAGTLNLSQPIRLRAAVRAPDTRMAAIQRLAERASLDRPGIVALTDRIAKVFVIVVLSLAALTFLGWYGTDPHKALWAAIAVLVVACPCALSLATPSAITAATMALRRIGFIVTRGHVLERLSKADLVIFDKTGTLTNAAPELVRIEPLSQDTSRDRDWCLGLAMAMEREANHPLAKAMVEHGSARQSNRESGLSWSFDHIEQHRGAGVEARIQGRQYRLGQAVFCGLTPTAERTDGLTQVFLSENQQPLACFVFRTGLLADAPATVKALRAQGLEVQIFTGDGAAPAQAVSQALGGIAVHASMTPEAKLAAVQALQQSGRNAVVIGDGINDIPVLSAASVSVAPLEATDLARNSSDALLLSRGLQPVAEAFIVARKTQRIIKQNLFWSFTYNMSTIPLAAMGMLPPWMAAIGMSASSVLVMLNSLRLTRATEPATAAAAAQSTETTSAERLQQGLVPGDLVTASGAPAWKS